MSRKGMPNIVYGKIFEAISNGTFPLNSRLPSENVLAGNYNVSRPTVRMALEFLKEDGLIYSVRGSGNYIKFAPRIQKNATHNFDTLSDLQRCFEFRTSLEADAAYYCARRHTSSDLIKLKSILEAMSSDLDAGISEEKDIEFHQMITICSKNEFYLRAFNELLEPLSNGMRIAHQNSLARPRDYLLGVQDEHRAIVDAIEARKPEGARQAMKHHLINFRDRLFDGISLDGGTTL
ncbi:FadR family transcriptional regulator [Hoeflea sp. G2-23]|uniref:FadR family transcriptional regulator n=1 Tax=Hoeflea algicola TaxID=2983763 RepID=A0ABT3Z504_9HYPH|nr:FadR/GntR family transcriptional regulator [Hoeflea algicola]MCY0146830.1 FadR family transcriptional regulator [Hoeflea algicola]